MLCLSWQLQRRTRFRLRFLSRCQRYDFHRITIDTIAARLDELLKVEGVEAEEKAVRYVAKAGDGSMRDALSLLDQCIAFYLGQELTYDKVLEVLGAVDTEVFSKLCESDPGRCDRFHSYPGGTDRRRQGTEPVCGRFYLVYEKSSSR